MRLYGPGGNSFELAVVGYQFPRAEPSGPSFDHDANWLVVDLDGVSADRRMAFRDPALLTTELGRLIVWFEGIERGLRGPGRFDFLEPVIGFELVSTSSEGSTIQVEFNVNLEDDDESFLRIDIALTPEVLHSAIDNLRSDFERFPVRR